MRGIRRSQAETGSSQRTRLPITPKILAIIHNHLPAGQDSLMLWAACCLGFLGFLRAGEFTALSPSEYDPNVHLSLADVALDSHSSPSVLMVRLKQSKTDPFGLGVNIFVGKTNYHTLCTLLAMTSYLCARGPIQAPFSYLGMVPSHLPISGVRC